MIKILELIDGGFIGGGQTHILSLVKCLDKKVYKPFIAASPNGEFGKIVKKNGYEFCSIELPKFYRSKYLKNIDRIVKEHSIDIIHSHGGVAGMYGRFYKKKYGNIKTVHTIHGIHYLNSGNLLRKYFSLVIEQFLVPYTDSFICVSDSDLKTAEKNKIIDKNKSTVIYNGIDLKKFSAEAVSRNEKLSREYNIDNINFIIGNISRFDYQKNQRFIISNLKKLFVEYPDIKILLAGDGKYNKSCRKQATLTGHAGRFIFTGEISNPEDHYSLFDIFIFPSLWEGLSISLIEAMASGRCILASDIEANKELIKNNSNGMLFSTENPDEYSEKLFKLIEDEKLRKRLSAKALEDSKNYSEEVMTLKTQSVYDKLNNT